jgi:hypothetical protein
MRSFVYQLVDRLAETGADFSRNRQFALLSSPAGHRARRLYRHLKSLTDDLSKHGDAAQVAVNDLESGIELRVEVASLKLVRTAWLTPEDLAVLARHAGPLPPVLARHLRPTEDI